MHRTERLDRRQAADHGVALGHPAGTERERDRDDGRQPSGMAATARLTEVRNMSSADSPLATPVPKTTAHTTIAAAAIRRPSTARRRCNGVVSTGCAWRRLAIWPSSVAMPVAVTTTVGSSVGGGGALERHVVTLGDHGSLTVGERAGRLRSRLGLAREGRLVDAQPAHVDEAQIGRDNITGRDHDQVPRHDVGNRDLR